MNLTFHLRDCRDEQEITQKALAINPNYKGAANNLNAALKEIEAKWNSEVGCWLSFVIGHLLSRLVVELFSC